MRVNPIWTRELRERWRTPRARLLFVLFLSVIGLVALVSDGVIFGDIDGDRHRAAYAGVEGFRNTMVVLMAFVCVVAPGVAAASISSERERQTLRLVHMTLLRPHEILLGKLAASLSFVLLLIACTLPIATLSLVLGGVTIGEMLRAYAMVVVVGAALAFIGVALSAWTKRSLTSVAAAYLILAVLGGGTAVAYIQAKDARLRAWQAELDAVPERQERLRAKVRDLRPRNPTWTVVLNPMVALASAIEGAPPREDEQYRFGFYASDPQGPTDGLFRLIATDSARLYAHSTFVTKGEPTVADVRKVFPEGDVEIFEHVLAVRRHTPIWVWSSAWYVLLGALAAIVGTLGLRRAR